MSTATHTSQVTSQVPKPEPKVLLSAVELASAQKQADDKKLPEGYKESLALLAEMNGRQFKGHELEVQKPLFRKLKQHIANLQKGLPTIPQHANDHAASYQSRNAAVQEYRLGQLARTNPEVKAIIAERDALKAAGTDEQLKKDLESAIAQIETLTAERDAFSASTKELEEESQSLSDRLESLTRERDALASTPKVFEPGAEKLELVLAAVSGAKSLKEAKEKAAELTASPAPAQTEPLETKIA